MNGSDNSVTSTNFQLVFALAYIGVTTVTGAD